MQKWPLPDISNSNNTGEPQHEVVGISKIAIKIDLNGNDDDGIEFDISQAENGPITSSGFKSIPATKTLVTRIYIDNAQNHKTVQLTNHLTTAMIIQYLKKKGLLDNTDQWTLFEIAYSHCVGQCLFSLQFFLFFFFTQRATLLERPFREWEIVLDVISTWEPDAGNALLVKKYPYYYTLIPEVRREYIYT